jgi:hypothetical protein
MDLENHPKTPKLWTIAHETAQKFKNDVFLVIPLKPQNPKIVGNSS